MTNPQKALYSMAKTKSISSKIRNKIRVPTVTITIQHSLEFLATVIGEEEEITGIQFEKEKIKLSLFADDLNLYIENPKDTARKLLELINEYSKVSRYKINTQKSLAFLYTTLKNKEEKLRKQSHL